MNEQSLGRYVQVLDQRMQTAQQAAAQAQQRLKQTQNQLERLKQLGLSAGVKKTQASVALYANAAGFRLGVMDMAEQCRDACGVQQLEVAQAQQHMHAALQRHESMHSVWLQARVAATQVQARQAQKVMDELAGQAWMRQHRNSGAKTESC